MEIIGVGIDIQEMDHIEKLFDDPDSGNWERVFTPEEYSRCMERSDRIHALAGRFSAKEAVIKSLSLPSDMGLVMNQIEILNKDDGSPFCKLHGRVMELSRKKGCSLIKISISHSNSYAVGMAISMKDE